MLLFVKCFLLIFIKYSLIIILTYLKSITFFILKIYSVHRKKETKLQPPLPCHKPASLNMSIFVNCISNQYGQPNNTTSVSTYREMYNIPLIIPPRIVCNIAKLPKKIQKYGFLNIDSLILYFHFRFTIFFMTFSNRSFFTSVI